MVAAAGKSSLSDLFGDPEFRAGYTRELVIGKLIQIHLGTGATVAQMDAFVEATVAAADVHIFISY